MENEIDRNIVRKKEEEKEGEIFQVDVFNREIRNIS